MGENYSSLGELWKAFDGIEKTYCERIGLQNRGEILQNFEKDKLRAMAERVVKNVENRSALQMQAKDSEIDALKAIAVSDYV